MLSNVTQALDAVQLSGDSTIDPAAPQVETERTVRDTTIRALYRFFTESCDFAQNEAEVRVAKIGNDLWGWNYTYHEEYDSLSFSRWKGCDAIRKHLARRDSTTDK